MTVTGRLMKMALAITYLAVAIFFLFRDNKNLSALFFAVAVFLLVAIVRQGSVVMAIKAIRDNNLAKAKFHVNETIRPEWLGPAFRAYHYMALGYIEAAEGKTDQAIVSFETALTHNIKHRDDTNIVKFQLAMLYANKREFETTKGLLAEIKKNNPNPGLLEQVRKAEKKVKAVTSGRIKFDDPLPADLEKELENEIEKELEDELKAGASKIADETGR